MWLREEPTQSSAKRKRAAAALDLELALEDEDLFEALKARRTAIASEAGVPPYVIFHDRTLLEMIHLRPKQLEAMLQVNGVGEAKLQKYGQQFLDVLNEFV